MNQSFHSRNNNLSPFSGSGLKVPDEEEFEESVERDISGAHNSSVDKNRAGTPFLPGSSV